MLRGNKGKHISSKMSRGALWPSNHCIIIIVIIIIIIIIKWLRIYESHIIIIIFFFFVYFIHSQFVDFDLIITIS